MKQLYTVPFNDMTMYRSVLQSFTFTMQNFLLQRVLDMDGTAQPQEYFYNDEAGKNLSKIKK